MDIRARFEAARPVLAALFGGAYAAAGAFFVIPQLGPRLDSRLGDVVRDGFLNPILAVAVIIGGTLWGYRRGIRARRQRARARRVAALGAQLDAQPLVSARSRAAGTVFRN